MTENNPIFYIYLMTPIVDGCAYIFLNPWVQRECSVQTIDSDSVITNRSHASRAGEIFYLANRIKRLRNVSRWMHRFRKVTRYSGV